MSTSSGLSMVQTARIFSKHLSGAQPTQLSVWVVPRLLFFDSLFSQNWSFHSPVKPNHHRTALTIFAASKQLHSHTAVTAEVPIQSSKVQSTVQLWRAFLTASVKQQYIKAQHPTGSRLWYSQGWPNLGPSEFRGEQCGCDHIPQTPQYMHCT